MFQLHMLGAVAQLERSLIRERQRQGIAIARAKRTYKGRLPVLNTEQIAQARQSVAFKVPKAQIARDLGVSRSALYDALASRGAYAQRGRADPVRVPQPGLVGPVIGLDPVGDTAPAAGSGEPPR